MAVDYLPTILIIIFVVAISLVLFYGSRRIAALTKAHHVIQYLIVSIIRGPVVVAILSYGFVAAVESAIDLNADYVPSFFHPESLLLIVQLIILAVSVRTAGVVIKQTMPSLTKAREADRILVYLVYTLGLVTLAYIVLTSPISPGVAANVWAVVNFLTGVFMTYLGVYVVNVVFKHYSQAIEGKESRLRTTITFVRRLILSLVALIGVAAATFTSFPAAGGLIASLFIAAGFASIVIGLAAQASLSNLVAGMVISTSQPFKIGEAVLFSNEWCWVEDIRLTFTVLKTWDNRRLMVPNQLFLNNTIVNYDANDSSKLCIVLVTITYESDMDRAIEILKDVARRHPDFLPVGNLPVVHVMDFTESGINLRLLSRAKDQPTNFQMSKDILYEVKKLFDSNDIRLAFPRRQVVIDSLPNTAEGESAKWIPASNRLGPSKQVRNLARNSASVGSAALEENEIPAKNVPKSIVAPTDVDYSKTS
ncbi:MAG TPA: mechanosensitive ion channel family protein [Nitrososphaerales archaeon]|nr:mechanosensitive ion channel family protein [Nitrososphaerales archaeon]